MRPATLRICGFVLVTALAAGRPAFAQDSSSLSDLLPELLKRGVTLAPPASGVNHEAHFQPLANPSDPLTQQVTELSNNLNRAILASLATFPLGSSSGGFVFEGDPAVGDFRPASRSFGPTFAERAFTSGKGNFNFGVTFQAASFDTFEGKNLDDGSIKFYLRHTNCCPAGAPDGFPNPAFEADLLREDLTMKLDTNTTALLFNYGITDRLDVGAAVPIVHVKIEADALATIDRITTGGDTSVHHFAGSDPDHQELPAVRGSATGLGDIVVRGKYRFLKAPGGGIAAGLDLRLPTGDEKDLLGIGAAQAKLIVIGSGEAGAIGFHGNLSYAFAGTSDVVGDIPKEIGYTGGVDVTAGRATIAFDVIGRTLRDTVRWEDEVQHEPIDTAGNTVARTVFTPFTGNLTQVLGVAGVKVLIAPHLLLTANALFALNDSGLKSKFTPVVGLEYVFPRQ
jgi:hypothetical protein